MLTWLPQNISTYGIEMDHLFRLMYYVLAVWFIAVEALILFFILRYHQSRQPKPVYVRGDTPSQAAWVLVPVLVVLMLDLGIDEVGGAVWDRIKIQLPPAAEVVHVTGKQFNWEFTYPGPDGKFGTADDLTIDNELHVPVGQTCQVRACAPTTSSTASSFPTFGSNRTSCRDARSRRWFNATKPGTYEIACAELCGFGHYIHARLPHGAHPGRLPALGTKPAGAAPPKRRRQVTAR